MDGFEDDNEGERKGLKGSWAFVGESCIEGGETYNIQWHIKSLNHGLDRLPARSWYPLSERPA